MPELASSYEDLYIYLIKGLVHSKEEPTLGQAFLWNWIEEETSFLFFSEPAEEIVAVLLIRRPDLQLLENYHFSYEEWQGAFSEPIRIDRFLIVPPWLDAVEGPGETKILLDPGLVFGTGLHASTRDSLRALSYVHAQFPVKKVVDLGTGTGVLALAGALLGAQQVLAVDLNPLCVNTARKNVQWNHLEDRIEVKEGRAEDFAELRADLARYGLRTVKAWEDEATWYTMLVSAKSV